VARFRLTLTLAAAAVAVLATAAVASPGTPLRTHLDAPLPSSGHMADGGMAAMHAQMTDGDMTGMHAQMADGRMTAMHAQMADGRMTAMHAQMAATPQMLEHMAAFGVAPDEMAEWMAEGRDWSDIHDELAARGVDVEAMMATCPMLEPGAVGPRPGSMPVDAQHARHHP
jgi:hypothetical protein